MTWLRHIRLIFQLAMSEDPARSFFQLNQLRKLSDELVSALQAVTATNNPYVIMIANEHVKPMRRIWGYRFTMQELPELVAMARSVLLKTEALLKDYKQYQIKRADQDRRDILPF